ncbi:aminotransferase class IV [Enemella sp. A6]|uniref:aminotransferase class IV n=1 Tax=Enemella sp. A6 TaxID=3440152 RepID=UPI003EB988FA
MTSAGEHDIRVWVNGTLYDDPAAATVSAVDHGLVAGNGVFEALKVESWGPFAVTRHLERLNRSAERMGLPHPDHDLLRQGIDAVLAGRTWELGKIRITWTGGRGPLGSGAPYGPPNAVVAAEATERPSPTTRIVTLPWTRNPDDVMAGVKTTSYGGNVRGLATAHAQEATEGIFVTTDGHIAEGTGTNIFFVIDGEVVTPPLDSGILDGITRALLVKWYPEVVERPITVAEARAADEVFLTSSLRDIQAVTSWDDREYQVGEVTTRMRELFEEKSRAEPDPT